MVVVVIAAKEIVSLPIFDLQKKKTKREEEESEGIGLSGADK